jgi:hypothetical protein
MGEKKALTNLTLKMRNLQMEHSEIALEHNQLVLSDSNVAGLWRSTKSQLRKPLLPT